MRDAYTIRGTGVFFMSTELQQLNGQNKVDLWAERISEYRNSRMSVKSWCKEKGICEQTYYKWQRKIFAMAQAQQELQFAEITPANLAYDSQIDAMAYCRRAEELFELYQRCANRRQVETICVNFLRILESTKLSVNGHLYFVPRHNMEKVDVFEDFVAELSRLSRNQTHLMANSIYIIDDAKQRQKMTEEFYSAVKKEISEYQERADYFIKSGCQSPSVMDRWVLKIQSLEGKKQHYEDVLRRELDGLDDDFATLKLLSQELSFRAQAIRAKKAA